MLRDILDYQNNKIGELDLPENTTEEVWDENLNKYKTPPVNAQAMALNWLIKDRKIFAEDMMERFKNRNILSGMNIIKALWLHHRTRSWPVTLPPQMGGFSYTVDILNMAVSGDLETAYFSLRYGVLDDMTQPYHCLDADTVGWLKNELSNYLGFNLG